MREGDRQKGAKGQGAGLGAEVGSEYLDEREAGCRYWLCTMSVLAGLRRIRGAVCGSEVA